MQQKSGQVQSGKNSAAVDDLNALSDQVKKPEKGDSAVPAEGAQKASSENKVRHEAAVISAELSMDDISRKEIPAKSALESLAAVPENKRVVVQEEEKKKENRFTDLTQPEQRKSTGREQSAAAPPISQEEEEYEYQMSQHDMYFSKERESNRF